METQETLVAEATCTSCKETLPLNQFKRIKYRWTKSCIECLNEAKERRIRLKLQKKLKINREIELKEGLRKVGLPLRDDSSFCANYINTGHPDIDIVVDRMCEVHYLYNYCDMYNEIGKIIKKRNKNKDHGDKYDRYDRWERSSPFDEAEENILERIGGYPETFPWIK